MPKSTSNQTSTQDLFHKFGYCKARAPKPVREMLPIITQYAKFQAQKDMFTEDQAQVVGCKVLYSDSLMESLLLHLTPYMQDITGVQYLFPTYTYTRLYTNGQELLNHTDRPACEISATLFIACSYQDFKWPIFMDNTAIYMEPGDIVAYRGNEIPHYRPPLLSFTGEEDIWHLQTFFHYVRADGPLSQYAFDQRAGIGLKKQSTKERPGFDYR